MSYEHPEYHARLERLTPSDKNYYPQSEWESRMLSNVSEGTRYYYAVMYPDGWFSVDGDEWYGEFASKSEAEAYLNVKFEKVGDLDD